MKRLLLLILVIIVAGCLGSIPAPINTDNAPPSPTKPAHLTRENITTYASQYERAAEYRTLKEPGVTVELACNATILDKTATGFYVVAGCAVTMEWDDSMATGGPEYGHMYFINDTTTIRMAPQYTSFQPSTGKMNGNEEDFTFIILNFDTEHHTVTVNITPLDATVHQQVFTHRYTISTKQGVVQERLQLRPGDYRLTARLSNERTVTRRLTVSDPTATRTTAVSVYITPNGEIQIIRRPRVDVYHSNAAHERGEHGRFWR